MYVDVSVEVMWRGLNYVGEGNVDELVSYLVKQTIGHTGLFCAAELAIPGWRRYLLLCVHLDHRYNYRGQTLQPSAALLQFWKCYKWCEGSRLI